MTKHSLPIEIKCLNEDIDKCKEKIEHLFGRSHYSKYCSSPMYHKNYVGISRKKTGNATVTKMEIKPKCGLLKETCVTERAIVDVNIIKHPSEICLRSKKGNSLPLQVPEMVDAATEPLKATEYKSMKDRDRPWGIILKSNHPVRRHNKHFRNVKSYRKHDLNSSGNSSSSSSSHIIFSRSYTKNKGVQCRQDERIEKEINPVSSIQTLLRHLKKKLKDNVGMKRKLDELEHEIQKLFDDQKNNTLFLKENKRNKENERYPEVPTQPSHLYLSQENRIDYVAIDEAHVKLEATCRELEGTCRKLKNERDTSLKLAADKSAELVETLVREAGIKKKLDETNNQINIMSVKLENYTISMKNLNEHVKRLQNENKEVKKLKQQTIHLNDFLRMVTEENKNLLSELQTITIERNKLQLALTVKEQIDEVELRNRSKSQVLEVERGQQKNKHIRPIEHPPRKELIPENITSSDTILITPHSNHTTNSHSGIAPSLYRDNSIISIKTPSPSSDHLMQLESLNSEQEEEEAVQKDFIPVLTIQRNSPIEHQLNLNKLEKLKEEIKIIFSEIRQLANDISSRKLIDFGVEDISTDLNWSEDSQNNSIIPDVHISDLDTN